MLLLKWEAPVNVGAQDLWIIGYNISIRTASTKKWIVTPSNATSLPFGGLSALTSYTINISAINAIGRGPSSPNVTFQTIDLTSPGTVSQIALVNRTGGLLTVNVSAPLDTGGAPITGYILYFADQNENTKVAYNGTGLPSSLIRVSVTKANTVYNLQAKAINSVGPGDLSQSFAFLSGPLSRPGPPRLPTVPFSRTGGAIALVLKPPVDTGGYEDISYTIYYREQGTGKRFRQAYCNTQGLDITVFRLAADTVYDMVGVSILKEDVNALAEGNISLSDSSIVLFEKNSSILTKTGYFDFGGYIFEVDSSQTQSSTAIVYLPSLSAGDGSIAIMDLMNFDVYDIFVRGAYSDVANFTTLAPTRPGVPPQPVLDYSTGGALNIRISWPNDTGGVPITSYEFYIDDNTVDGTLYSYLPQDDFALEVTVQIGGLAPETTYNFYYIPINDASACPGMDDDIPKRATFETDVASLSDPVQLIRASGATGGGIHVEMKAPNDRGSDSDLYYQVYMSPSRPTPVWTLVYNGTDNAYWQTKLEKVTEYLFKATCMNEVGPDDDGGSAITSYSVYAKDTSGEVDLVKDVETTDVSFGGLLAKRKYEFKVVPLAQQNITITGLTPRTDYVATVRVIGDGLQGKASKIIYFKTPQSSNQPRPPAVGCHSRTVAIIFWEAEDDANSYFLYRNGKMLSDNGDDITFEDTIEVGTTYAYKIQVKKLDGTLSDFSEATQFVATAPISSGFDCFGRKGHIHWHDYHNSDHETWTISPEDQAGLLINVGFLSCSTSNCVGTNLFTGNRYHG
ncbi:hypothetical protein KRP22_010926 [Phytophthora ramorum]|nr:Titin [Phytophthora ramorum]